MRHRDPDVILAAWLDELAQPLPPETKRAIEVGIQMVSQRRRPWWLPRRFDTMTTSVSRTAPRGLLAVAAAVGAVALAIGVLTLVRPGSLGGVGVPGATDTAPSTPAPTASAAGSPSTAGWEPFTSERYGFEVQHPADWTVIPAVESYGLPEPPNVSLRYDRIVGDPATGTAFTGTGMAMNGLTADAWFAEYCWDASPQCPTTALPQITVDGRSAFLNAPATADAETIEVFAFVEDRLYILVGWGPLAHDRPLFDAFLSTVRFHPEDAVDPSASAVPSTN